ncbi:MAG TPA: alanine--tRNA ligase [Candidatus Micrarchaeia archaeon]|nr:alanine--tRNA ligase [Candidatus Micrarchaeia archaeon]
MRHLTIRERFFDFFTARGHQRIPSASLVPEHDPSLLLVSAGMVPLKPYFLGLREPPATRLASCQKSFRTSDIEEVGRTPRHDTFFEMLGNFSFGDYFKAEAIGYARAFLVDELGLDPGRLLASVHPDDGEARAAWTAVGGVPADRVVALADNFWQAGETGPCGTDSEVYYDLGPAAAGGPDDRPGQGHRYLECWNLVFMQYDRGPDGSLTPLPRTGVDTGMGLERLAMVLQGADSIFETDLFRPLVVHFAERSGLRPAEATAAPRLHLRVLADHARAVTMLLADGVAPSNDGRGYVLRRLVRRALVHARGLHLEGGLVPAVGVVVESLGPVYPELALQRPAIEAQLAAEEGRFADTLARGLEHFEAAAGRADRGVVSGADAFRLHDTHGLPLELTADLAAERGLAVDAAGALALLEAQRERARTARAGSAAGGDAWDLGTGDGGPQGPPATVFVGEEALEAEARVLAVRAGPDGATDVWLDRSPFYAEGGGQVGDRGRLTWPGGSAEVVDTRPLGPGQVHRCRAVAGTLAPGTVVSASVDPGWRGEAARHHSATHLVNAALRLVLGPGVVQRGSYVAPDHATFDFTSPTAPTKGQLDRVMDEVMASVRADVPRRVEVMASEKARATGAIALPDELYGELVRVVSFGDASRELCGGTHVRRSGEVGAVLLTGERSVGSGLRRLELVAGAAADRRWRSEHEALRRVAATLGVTPAEVPERAERLRQEVQRLEQGLRAARRAALAAADTPVLDERVGPHRLVVRDQAGEEPVGELREVADRLLLGREPAVAMVLAGRRLVCKLTPRLVAEGLRGGALARVACEAAGGRGGGNDLLGSGEVDAGRHHQAVGAVRAALAADGRGSGR